MSSLRSLSTFASGRRRSIALVKASHVRLRRIMSMFLIFVLAAASA
jgi:hypothetical protein